MRKNVLTGLMMIAAVAVLSGCGNKNQKTDENQTEKVLVKTSRVVLEDVEQIAQFTSSIEAYKQNNISPSMPVRIDKILVDVGSRVSKGQLLVVMDQTQYNQTSVQLANIEADYNRIKSVYDAGGISKQSLDQQETQLKVQRDAIKNLRDNIELRSPIDGVIAARNYDPGDMYSGGGEPILQVMQINLLKVAIDISESYFPEVKIGMPVDIVADVFPDEVFTGKVSLIYPSIDPSTRTFKVEVTIPNASGKLRPGMFSRSTIKFGSKPGYMVEDLAIQKQIGTNEKYVYVIRDGAAQRRAVTTGRQIGSKVNVLAGVNAGDQIAVAGMSKLSDGTQVEVKNN